MKSVEFANAVASKTDAAVPAAFDRAANLILDTVEEAFGIIAPNGRHSAYVAVVNVLHHYTIPKLPALPVSTKPKCKRAATPKK